jgi:hypothetical protein
VSKEAGKLENQGGRAREWAFKGFRIDARLGEVSPRGSCRADFGLWPHDVEPTPIF